MNTNLTYTTRNLGLIKLHNLQRVCEEENLCTHTLPLEKGQPIVQGQPTIQTPPNFGLANRHGWL